VTNREGVIKKKNREGERGEISQAQGSAYQMFFSNGKY